MNTPRRYSRTLTAKRHRAAQAAARKAAQGSSRRPSALPPLPRPDTAAWRSFALGAVQAAESDARCRRRWTHDMAVHYQGRRLAYRVTNLGRVLVHIGRREVGGRYGALWD